jgi:CBS domain-containing protein
MSRADARAAPAILHLSLVVGGELCDSDGGRLGKVDDLLVRLGDDEYPPVGGVVARVAGRQVFVPAERIGAIGPGRVTVTGLRIDLQPFGRREGEVLLKHDLLDRQLINVDGARLVRANEIEIARVEGWWRVVGVDVGVHSLLRRLLPRALASRVGTSGFLDWASLEPFTGHIPTIRLRVPHPKLARLHPAELADLVEAAPHGQGEEIIAAVHHDPELEADVFEELADEHQLEFLEERSDAELAELVARMEADDAADLVARLDDERRDRVLELLPAVQQRRLRTLLGYEPLTAGGLMSPELVAVYAQATQAEALDRVRRATVPTDALAWIFVVNVHRRYRGAVSLPDLVRADPHASVADLVAHSCSVRTDAALEDVARLMTDYDLTVVPVLDDQERPIGVVTVDDVLEVLMPPPGRRFGIFGGS